MTRDCCPFCNAPGVQREEEADERLLERVEKYNDAEAMNVLGCQYRFGVGAFDVDHVKAVEMYRRASELGCAEGHANLGNSYYQGKGIEQNMKKAIHHYQIAAMLGDEVSRHNLGRIELEDRNMDRGMRHFMIAAKCGFDDSLNMVRKGYTKGLVTKDDFEMTLRAYQASCEETKSEQRDRANALYTLFDPQV